MLDTNEISPTHQPLNRILQYLNESENNNLLPNESPQPFISLEPLPLPEPPSSRHKSSVIQRLFGSVPTLVFKIVCLVTSQAMISVGALYIDKCPKQPYIPIFLVVAGVLTFGSVLMSVLIRVSNQTPAHLTENKKDRILRAITNLLYGLTFSWFVAGLTWTYSAYLPTFDYEIMNSSNFCNRNLYLFAFWLITPICFLFAATFIVGTCCLVLGIATRPHPTNDADVHPLVSVK